MHDQNELATHCDRRHFLQRTAGMAAATALAAGSAGSTVIAQSAAKDGAISGRQNIAVTVDLPRLRVPMSFIIDDSTCLVNMGRFCMPQFATAWPDRDEYDRPWQSWPAEIPDDFVRRFGSWCQEHHVRGKYSIVPYPACVGWLDRELPGWSRAQLQDSLKLVRELMLPNWDIHPEMITHTRLIDIKSGRPMADIHPGTMENSFPQVDQSVDELASYLAYALRVLKNCDLPCEGITTPGGFGNKVKDKLPLAVFDAVRDVYGTDLPHYFKYVIDGNESTEPKLEGLRDANSDSPRVTVNVPAATGDWFGGWDGARESEGYKYANHDATDGRMVERIEHKQPAIMLCHWAGLYGNGSEQGFQQFQQVVLALEQRFKDEARWMKVSEIGRYYAVKQLIKIETSSSGVVIQSPFQCPDLTLRISGAQKIQKVLVATSATDKSKSIPLKEVNNKSSIDSHTLWRDGEDIVVCTDVRAGKTQLQFVSGA